MKNRTFKWLLLCGLFSQTIQAQTTVNATFGAAIKTVCSTCIQETTAPYVTLVNSVCAAQTTLNVGGAGVTDLTGIATFSSLTNLNCASNSLTSIPTLPNTITELNCTNNNITSFANLPTALKNFYFYQNANLTTLPSPLPSGLEILWGYNCKFTSLPAMPSTMKSLFMDGNPQGGGVFTIPNLSGTALLFLHVQSCAVSSVPTLPSTIKEVYLSFNSLTDATVPNLPTGLQVLRVADNSIVCLPMLPSTLVELVTPAGVTCILNKPSGLVNGNGASLPLCTNGACGSSLYVNLADFSAKPNGQSVDLAWETEEEVDFKNFEIERSQNGRYFTPISKIAAKGSGKSTTHYAFTDENPSNGLNYYRLKMNDLDGKVAYSKVKTAGMNFGKQFNLYPNPASEVLVFDYYGKTNGQIDVILMDIAGRVILQKQTTQSLSLDLNAVKAGLYLAKIRINDKVFTEKIVKQ